MEGGKEYNQDSREVLNTSPEVDQQVDQFSNNSDEFAPVSRRSRREKLTVLLIIIVAFVAVITGYWTVYDSIKRPSWLVPEIYLASGGQDDIGIELEEMLAQQQKDTDGDGLSDYDELNIYRTSPYLEDSDGDGLTDKQEVDSGDDPNCPQGQNCFRVDNTSNIDSSVFNPAGSNISGSQVLSGQATPEAVRDALLQGGFPQDTLDTISDDDLMDMYYQTLSEEEVAAEGQSVNSDNIEPSDDFSGLDINSVEDLQNLTGAQVRELMISQGAPADLIAGISDEELKQLFLSQLENQINNQ